MAQHLARIHGTEEDKVNCPFYFKIGACRHSDRCSRLHHKPAFSPTLLIKHIYQHPTRQAELAASANRATDTTEQAQEEFLCFYEDMYTEFSKFGRVQELHVVDNVGDHMVGHVYVKFGDEEQASDAIAVMQGRYYDGRQMQVEFSPVTDFAEARCRDYDEDTCARGGFCNFLHAKPVPEPLLRSLLDDCERDRRRHEQERKEKERDERRKSKKRKKERREDRDRNHGRSKRSRREDRSGSSTRGRSEDRESSSEDDDRSAS
jgi:splicing factor U2AF 35 kDa subunit